MKFKTPKPDLSNINIREIDIPEIPDIPQRPPRAFDGQEPLAYIRDLITLQKRVVKWLTGSEDPAAIEDLISGYGFVPLNIEKKIDDDFFNFGLSTYFNSALFSSDLKGFNFSGRYVYLKPSDINSSIVEVIIDDLQGASHLGTNDGDSDGHLYFNEETSEHITYSTLGKTEQTELKFGDWTTGDEVATIEYINDGNLVLENTDYINFNGTGTFFVIEVLSPSENPAESDVVAEVVSESISESKNNVLLLGGDWNHYIKLDILDFQQATEIAYKGKLRITFNLNEIFKNVNYYNDVEPHRFKIRVSHHNYNNYIYGVDEYPEYVQKNIFTTETGNYIYISNRPLNDDVSFNYDIIDKEVFNSSNIDQIYSGKVKITLDNILNLWDPTGIPEGDDIITISSNLFDGEFIPYSKENFINNSYLNINQKSTYQVIAPIKSDFITLNQPIEFYYKVKNLVSEIEDRIIIPPSALSQQINTIVRKEKSTLLREVFNDDTPAYNGEQHRVLEQYILNSLIIPPTFPEKFVVVDFDTMDLLEVIPGVGLVYPEKFKNVSYNNLRNYCRAFYISKDSFNNHNIGATLALTDNDEYGKTYNVYVAQQNEEEWHNLEEYKSNSKRVGNTTFIQFKLADIQLLKVKIEANNEFTCIRKIELLNFDTFNTFDYNNENDIITYKLDGVYNNIHADLDNLEPISKAINNKWKTYSWNSEFNKLKTEIDLIKLEQFRAKPTE